MTKFARYDGLFLRRGDNFITTTYEPSGSPSFLSTDGSTVAWYDYATDVTKDASNYVSEWADKLGSGHDLLNPYSAGSRPIWSANGILFDGTANYSDILAGTFTYNQPEFIYMVIKQVTWQDEYRIFGPVVGGYGSLIQGWVTSPYIIASAGAESGYLTTFTTNTWGIIRVLFNGANSKLILNAGTPITGNFGAGNMGGLSLGSNEYEGQNSNIQVKEIILRQAADSTANEAAIYDYLKAKYGL